MTAPTRAAGEAARASGARQALGALLLVGGSAAGAHGPDDFLPVDLWRTWSTDWWVWAMLLVPAALYLRGVRRLWRHAVIGAGVRPWQVGAFAGGWVALALSMVSPLDALSAQLFAAHMVQHEVMMLVAAPLLVAGSPFGPMIWGLPRQWRPWIGRSPVAVHFRRAAHALGSPMTAWSIHTVILWIWHAPPLMQAALRHDLVHDLQHASFFLSALLFWWALFRDNRRGNGHGAGIFYLFTTLLHTSVLGALLAFSPHVWFPAYERTAPAWGLTALQDQQLGGLIMWGPGGVVYLAAGLVLLASLLSVADRQR